MSDSNHRAGMIVTHPNKSEWGLGKIQAVEGKSLTIYFRDICEEKPGDAQKTFRTDHIKLNIVPVQNDLWLDNLPPYKVGHVPPKKIRLTLQQGTDYFLARFPGGFKDKVYLNDPECGERQYKWDAHLHYVELLEDGQYLKIPKSTVYLLAQEGKIPCQKVGRHWRFKREVIDRWMEYRNEE